MTPSLVALGLKLKVARVKLQYTQFVVSTFIGLKNETMISRYECAKSAVPIERLLELSDILDLNVDELLMLRIRHEQEKAISRIYGEGCVQ